jgi:hypothetical protein
MIIYLIRKAETDMLLIIYLFISKVTLVQLLHQRALEYKRQEKM